MFAYVSFSSLLSHSEAVRLKGERKDRRKEEGIRQHARSIALSCLLAVRSQRLWPSLFRTIPGELSGNSYFLVESIKGFFIHLNSQDQ